MPGNGEGRRIPKDDYWVAEAGRSKYRYRSLVTTLPPGQRVRRDMRPFGLPWYAHRMPTGDEPVAVRIGGLVSAPFLLGSDDLAAVGRQSQASDFHCVTTWTRIESRWGGVPFRSVYEQLIAPRIAAAAHIERVCFVGADGYRDSLPLADVLRDDILLADQLDGLPLSRGNGAPLRLIAPAHYGYKNVKYVVAVELLGPPGLLARVMPSLHHPRARVAFEERFYGLPGVAIRYAYRPAVAANAWWFRRSMRRHP